MEEVESERERKDKTINNMHIILHLNRIIRKVKMIKLESGRRKKLK